MKKHVLTVLGIIIFFVSQASVSCSTQNDSIKVGYIKNGDSLFLAPAMEYSNSHYELWEFEESDEIINSLNRNEIDCALIDYSEYRGCDGYQLVAGTSVLNTVIAGRGGDMPCSFYELQGRDLLIPETMLDTDEYRMLQYMKDFLNISFNEVTISVNEMFSRIMNTDENELFCLIPDAAGTTVMTDDNVSICFDTASEWERIISSNPPVKSVIIVKNELCHDSRLNRFLCDCCDSISFVKAHRSKAALLCIDTGFSENMPSVKKQLSHNRFVYIDEKMLTIMLESNELLKKYG